MKWDGEKEVLAILLGHGKVAELVHILSERLIVMTDLAQQDRPLLMKTLLYKKKDETMIYWRKRRRGEIRR